MAKKPKSKKKAERIRAMTITLELRPDGEEILEYKAYKSFEKKTLVMMLKDIIKDIKKNMK